MDIRKRKSIRRTFFGIKADRDALYCSDIVYSASLLEICQRNMTVFLIHTDRCDRSGNFLDKCQSLFSVLFICTIYKILQSGSPQTSAVPCCHFISP